MARIISIGAQGFEELRALGCFYVDKTDFIRRWWEGADPVTLVCRPRRFGKTLNLDTVRCFLSTSFAGRGEELFGDLAIWNSPSMRALQGTVPVVSLSFARVKQRGYESAMQIVRRTLRVAVDEHRYLADSPALSPGDRAFLASVSDTMDDATAADCLNQLCSMLERHWGTKPVVLLDEYDAPMQEAWLAGYWDQMSGFMRGLFNATFKTNTSLGRALITGVTRVSRESIFSDLNNVVMVTTSTPLYQDCFGFTEAEVGSALAEYDLADQMGQVRDWYDGFSFGGVSDVYNPWSITQFLKLRRLDGYWANTSSNGLVSSLVRLGDADLKSDFEDLLAGGHVEKVVDEQVAFGELATTPNAIWSLLLAAGYVRPLGPAPQRVDQPQRLAITNHETMLAFDGMVRGWFSAAGSSYGRFAQALLAGDVRAMNAYLSDVVAATVSSFDSATHPGTRTEPERFYHGLVLGMLVELRGRYAVESNRESGFGRYDVALVPTRPGDPAVIMEFKVQDAESGERTLEDAVAAAHVQMSERDYARGLAERGVPREKIREYGIAFSGKRALVG